VSATSQAAQPASGAPTAASPAPTPPPRRRRARVRALSALLLVVVVCAGAWAVWWELVGRVRVSTDNAYVGGNVVQVTPQITGTVTRVFSDDTQLVEAGDELVRLDPTDYELQLAGARAALADAVRTVRALYANTGQARAAVAGRQADSRRARFELAAAQAALDKAQSELVRREALAARNFVSPESVQSARTALDAAIAQRDAARAALAQGETAVTAAGEQLRAAAGLVDSVTVTRHPRVVAAATKVREAHLALGRTSILAPVGGYVAKRSVQVGQRVAPGNALMALIPADQLWVDANFKEAQLEHVRIGQQVSLKSDLYGSSVAYKGRVVGLAMGTGSAFALLPAQNATGNWIKVVQRVPVRVALDPGELAAHPLRIGLSMEATIDTTDRSGDVLARSPARKGFETGVYDDRSDAADALIERIIAENLGSDRP
jgi:membrane fusion protein (multidrug efflux system)